MFHTVCAFLAILVPAAPAAAQIPPFRAAGSNVQSAVIPNSGHWLMEENPRDTIAAVTGFLQ